MYEEFISYLKRYCMPVVKNWLGEMLNYFDKTKTGLKALINQKGGLKGGKVTQEDLQFALEKMRHFEGKEVFFFLNILDIDKGYRGLINWDDIKNPMYNQMKRNILREEHTL